MLGYIIKHHYNCNILYYVRTSDTPAASCIPFSGLNSTEANGRRHLQTTAGHYGGMQNIDIGLAPLINCLVCLVTDETQPKLWPRPIELGLGFSGPSRAGPSFRPDRQIHMR